MENTCLVLRKSKLCFDFFFGTCLYFECNKSHQLESHHLGSEYNCYKLNELVIGKQQCKMAMMDMYCLKSECKREHVLEKQMFSADSYHQFLIWLENKSEQTALIPLPQNNQGAIIPHTTSFNRNKFVKGAELCLKLIELIGCQKELSIKDEAGQIYSKLNDVASDLMEECRNYGGVNEEIFNKCFVERQKHITRAQTIYYNIEKFDQDIIPIRIFCDSKSEDGQTLTPEEYQYHKQIYKDALKTLEASYQHLKVCANEDVELYEEEEANSMDQEVIIVLVKEVLESMGVTRDDTQIYPYLDQIVSQLGKDSYDVDEINKVVKKINAQYNCFW